MLKEDQVPDERAVGTFPTKLYDLITHGDSSIIRWEDHGRAFRIVNNSRFSEEILPKCFRHSKLASFQRQLNLYGFRRITKGEDQGAYYHPKFQRGKEQLAKELRRLPSRGIPGTDALKKMTSVQVPAKAPSNVDNFYSAMNVSPSKMSQNVFEQIEPDDCILFPIIHESSNSFSEDKIVDSQGNEIDWGNSFCPLEDKSGRDYDFLDIFIDDDLLNALC